VTPIEVEVAMRLRRVKPGEYSGLALWTIAGHWVVSVSEYQGWDKQTGHEWQSVSIESFFRLDVLKRELVAVGIQMEANQAFHEQELRLFRA
jgi:hypothetical protein